MARLLRQPACGAAFAVLGLLVLAAIFAQFLAPYGLAAIDLRARLAPPVFLGGAWTHPLGTDHLGRDVLTRLLYSLQMTMAIALVGTVMGAIIGTVAGLVAAHYRGLVDDAIMLLVDTQAAVPFIIIALGAIALFGNSLLLFFIVVGLSGWEGYARITRGLAMQSSALGYVVAVRLMGAGWMRVYLCHVLPNIASALIVNLTLSFPSTILLESALSFVGMGIQPPLTSLGSMLGYGRDYLFTHWWLAVFPGMLIFLAALSISILGDALRDKMAGTR